MSITTGDEVSETFEMGPIRPPSEAYSLLIRATRNCPWNRCRFCRTYKGQKFSLRPVDEIKKDIQAAAAIADRIKAMAWQSGQLGKLREFAGMVYNNAPDDAYRNVALWLYAGGTSAFLQDANTLIMRTPEMVDVIRFLKTTLPTINRVTSYARSKTAAKKTDAELAALREAGLSRLHMGLESGYDPLLEYIDKGVTAADHIAGGKKVVASGISLCQYVILGLGGRKMWREHATETARVLSEIDPAFIRVRTLTVNSGMPLSADVADGSFTRQTDEEIVEEEKLFITGLQCHSNFVSDHINNLLPEVEGKLPEEKPRMLAVIERFQGLPDRERANYRVGRRVGIYERLDDMDDPSKREAVERVAGRLGGDEISEETIYSLMERFI